MDDDEIKFERLDPPPAPTPEDSGWIKDAAGQIIGYKNVKIMTRAKVEEMFPEAAVPGDGK